MSAGRAKVEWHEFANAGLLAAQFAVMVASKLAAAIELRGQAMIAVSGGSTPARFFSALSTAEIDWSKVTVILIDERMVADSSERSNARLVRTSLLTNKAEAARFIPLYQGEGTSAPDAGWVLGDLPCWPLDVAVLGMGADGHTASYFPDAPDIAEILDPDQKHIVLRVEAPSAGEPRLTLSLPRVVGAGFIALHIEGAIKRAVLEDELARRSPRLPVGKVIAAATRPLHIYWAP